MSNEQMYSELNPIEKSVANDVVGYINPNNADFIAAFKSKVEKLKALIEKWENFKSDDVQWIGGAGNRNRFLSGCKKVLASANEKIASFKNEK